MKLEPLDMPESKKGSAKRQYKTKQHGKKTKNQKPRNRGWEMSRNTVPLMAKFEFSRRKGLPSASSNYGKKTDTD